MTGKLRIDKKFPPRHRNTWKKRTARFVGSSLVDFTFVGVVPFSTSLNVTGSLTDDRCVHCYAKITFPLGRLVLAWEKYLRVLDKMGVIDFFCRISGAKRAIYSVFLRVDYHLLLLSSNQCLIRTPCVSSKGHMPEGHRLNFIDRQP